MKPWIGRLDIGLPVKDLLRHLCCNRVENHNHSQCNEEWKWQWTELKKLAQRTVGNNKGHSCNEQGGGQQIFSRPALEEGSAGTNDENDKGSRYYRLHEPASSKLINRSMQQEKQNPKSKVIK